MGRRVTLIAGSGSLVPHLVAVLQRSGDAAQILSLGPASDSPGSIAVSLGDPYDIIGKIKAFRSTHLAFAGAVHVSDAAREAWLGAAGISSGSPMGDSALATAVAAIARELGLELVGAHQFAPELLAPDGPIAGPPLDAGTQAFAVSGLAQARRAGALDLGQALVLSGRRVVAAEDIAGTDALLARVKTFRERGLIGDGTTPLILAKAKKPGQPDFGDLPAIGPATIGNAAAAGIAVIVVEAGQSLLLNRAALVALAAETGVSVVGITADG